ncbi:MAG: hypothetical protein ABL903_03380 [Methylococcales bacterium]
MNKTSKVLLMGLGLMIGCTQPLWAAGPVVKTSLPKPSVAQFMDFSYIQDFAVAADGSLWVLDTMKIQHLTTDGTLIKQFGDGIEPHNIRKIALVADGSVWLVGEKTAKLQHYSADGVLISTFTVEGDNAANINLDIQIASDGSVWALDTLNARVLHYKADGTLITQFGRQGSGAGEFTGAKNIAVAKDGSVWVSDGVIGISDGGAGGVWTFDQNYRLQHFSADGKMIGQFSIQQAPQDLRTDISDFAIAADGSLWLADSADQNNFKHLKADGTLIGQALKSTAFGSVASQASHIALAADGGLWAVSGGRFLRHWFGDLVTSEWVAKAECMTEYDDIKNTVYLWGVTVDQQSYDVVLQAQNGRFELVGNTPSRVNCLSSLKLEDINWFPNFDVSTHLLNIPYVLVPDSAPYGVPFRVTFKYLGGQAFALQSADQF